MVIRVHSWFKTPRREAPSGQISGWKARPAFIRVHSCSFVVQNAPPAFHPQPLPALHEFVPIRVHSWFKTPPLRFTRSHCPHCMNSCPFVFIRGSKRPPCVSPAATARAARIRGYSCPFVVQKHTLAFDPQPHPRCTNSWLFVSIRGSKPSPAFDPQPHPRCINSCPFVFIRGSKPPAAFHPQPQPALHEFVPIRIHSWFKTTRCVSPAATARTA